jgi:predicted PurR-regulated permease PerM
MFGLDSRAAKVAWTWGLVALGFYAAFAARKALLTFVLAVFFAYMMAPLVAFLERRSGRRIAHTAAVAAAFALVITAVAVSATLIMPNVVEEAQNLLEQLPPKLAEKTDLAGRLPLPSWLEPLRTRIDAFVQQNIREATAAALPFARSAGTQFIRFFGNVIYVVLIPILAFFFIKDGRKISATLVVWLRPLAPLHELYSMFSDIHQSLGRYVSALGLLCLATLLAYGSFLTAIGVPYALLLAAVAAVLEFIPLVGPLIAAIVTLVVSGIDGYGHLLWIAAFLIVYRLFQDYILYPYLMGGGAQIHPVLVIFGLLAGEQLGGVAGIFLSVPVISVLVILGRHLQDKAAADARQTSGTS